MHAAHTREHTDAEQYADMTAHTIDGPEEVHTMAWELDAAHSLIEFSAKHMMVTTVKGRFTKHSGVLELDEQNPSASKVDVTIDVNSLYSGDEKRDAHLLSADFFDAEKYPTITYKSTKVEEV